MNVTIHRVQVEHETGEKEYVWVVRLNTSEIFTDAELDTIFSRAIWPGLMAKKLLLEKEEAKALQ